MVTEKSSVQILALHEFKSFRLAIGIHIPSLGFWRKAGFTFASDESPLILADRLRELADAIDIDTASGKAEEVCLLCGAGPFDSRGNARHFARRHKADFLGGKAENEKRK